MWLSSRVPASPLRPARGLALSLSIALLMSGCAITTPDPRPPTAAPARWQGPLPHGGQLAAALDWWAAVGDPVLVELIAAAQQDNPALAAALARIDQARAAARLAGASLIPRLEANTTASRAKTQMPPPPMAYTSGSASADAVWELDLFGALRRGREAAVARAEAARLQWHDARVTLAAEVAQAYLDLRTCEALVAIYREDHEALARLKELTGRKVASGFGAPADLELVTASTAEGSSRVRGQDAQCRLNRITLAWLTGLEAGALETRLAAGRGQLPQPAGLAVQAIPAEVLAQRPDLAALEQELMAGSLDVGVAQAERYPKLRLTGSIGYSRVRALGESFGGPQWSIGPGLIAPLFDGGRSAALVAQADARFAEAVATWQQRARLAVREVETALVRIDGAEARLGDADTAVAAFQRYQKATETRYETGAGSLFEQEDARRSTLQASGAALQLRAERFAAWLSLYKAVGGGWQAGTAPAAAAARTTSGRP